MRHKVYRASAAAALAASIAVVVLLLTDNALRTWLIQTFSQWPDRARIITAAIGGYLIGSIPFGYLIIGVLRERDIRDEGSGRIGGTNAFRTGGFGAGTFTIIADLVKGMVGVVFGALAF